MDYNVHSTWYILTLPFLREHLKLYLSNLQTIFQRLRQAGLKLKPKKHSMLSQAKYLGHIVSSDGVSADPEKTNNLY